MSLNVTFINKKTFSSYVKAVQITRVNGKYEFVSVTTNSYLPFYASDFNLTYELEVVCINICCFILVKMNQE